MGLSKNGEGSMPNGPPTILNAQMEKELPYLTKTDDKTYIRHLENRLQYLESRLSYDGSQIYSSMRDGETEKEETNLFLNPSSKWRYSHRNQVLLVDSLCKTIFETLSPENKAKVQLPRPQYFGWNLSGTHYLGNDELPEPPFVKLPNTMEFYTDYFFREINQLYALVHEPVFIQQLATYLEMADNSERTSQARLFEAMWYLMVALSIRFTEFEKKRDLSLEALEMEEKMFRYAYRVVSILSFQWESFELIQCWLLITLYLRITHRQTSCFYSLGYAVTMAKAMGISRDSSRHRLLGTPYEEIKAHRVFWVLFTFERLIGLQNGRYGLIGQDEVEIPFPSYDFTAEKTRDNWITLPSLALIHIAKLATFVHTSRSEKLDLVKYQQINKELVGLNAWLNTNGFSINELFNAPDEKISSLVKSQVMLHYYDLVLCIHGKILFNFVGSRIATPGLKIEMVLDSCKNILSVLAKVHKANLLFVPWHLTLMLLFNVGVILLVLINAGLYLPTARSLYFQTTQLLLVLKRANVKSSDNKVLIKRRFKMSEECLWALKTTSKMVTLRFEQDLQNFAAIGTDPGSSEVNQATFDQYGFVKETEDEFKEVSRTGKRRKTEEVVQPVENVPHHAYADFFPMTGTNSDKSEFNEEPLPGDPSYVKADTASAGIYNNLLWFDRWFDSNLDNEVFMSGMDQSNMPPPSASTATSSSDI
ncbi:fungal zinc cluster transcription factor [Yamadazyma tenuis]|uniref:fungal zinc cluster transcription factor n=1 Tax=Candida tenuis TaxID=2315449 RepID=UPI0027AAEF9A|nr:fungal zinc cluster transcription factor [Yamadazyma tenuis]